MTEREKEIIGLIKREVKPALGCTEPVAVALAVSKAVELLCSDSSLDRLKENFKIKVSVSANILKNGTGVGIPGTDMIGIHIAAALGAVGGRSDLGLEVLEVIDSAVVERAKNLVKEGNVSLSIADVSELLYVKAFVSSSDTSYSHTAYAIIKDDHDKIVETGKDGAVLYSLNQDNVHDKSILDWNLTVREIVDFATNVPFCDIDFILEERKLNLALANEGINGNYGLKVGKTIIDNKDGCFGDGFIKYAMGLTAGASDARMAGSMLPAMSNSGSGNQGITVSMPVIAYGLKYGTSDERLARALILSNLIAIHIKGYLGKLSALCGCVVASTGSSCGLVYLKGGGYEQICSAIKNMIGNISGMVCDGAKWGCSMKVASGTACAIQSALLAIDNICVHATDGIIEEDIEKTIRNIGRLGSNGMRTADQILVDIICAKN